jgi:phosphatidylethanolamine-binding protein (PEBP) family uncharacterized protein
MKGLKRAKRDRALDAAVEAAAGLTKDQLLEVMEGHVLDEGELVGTYERR